MKEMINCLVNEYIKTAKTKSVMYISYKLKNVHSGKVYHIREQIIPGFPMYYVLEDLILKNGAYDIGFYGFRA